MITAPFSLQAVIHNGYISALLAIVAGGGGGGGGVLKRASAQQETIVPVSNYTKEMH